MKDPRPVMDRALEYVGLLAVGSEIVDEVDGQVVADFRHLLAPLLFKRGLYLERTARGRIVSDRAPWSDTVDAVRYALFEQLRAQPITCATCKRSWFSCEHGPNTGVVVAGPIGFVMPQLTAVRAQG